MVAAQVGQVFAQRELAVDLDAVHHRVFGVLVDDALRSLLKLAVVLRRPPVLLGLRLARTCEIPRRTVRDLSAKPSAKKGASRLRLWLRNTPLDASPFRAAEPTPHRLLFDAFASVFPAFPAAEFSRSDAF